MLLLFDVSRYGFLHMYRGQIDWAKVWREIWLHFMIININIKVETSCINAWGSVMWPLILHLIFFYLFLLTFFFYYYPKYHINLFLLLYISLFFMTFSIPTILVLKKKAKNNNSNTKYAYGGILEKLLIFFVTLLPFLSYVVCLSIFDL